MLLELERIRERDNEIKKMQYIFYVEEEQERKRRRTPKKTLPRKKSTQER